MWKKKKISFLGKTFGGKKYQLSEIAAMPQVIVSPSRPNLKGSHDDWFAEKGYQRNIVMSVPSFLSASNIIQSTNTICFLPSRLLPDPKIVPLEISENTHSFDVIVAWHPRSNNNPLHQWILSIVYCCMLRSSKVDNMRN